MATKLKYFGVLAAISVACAGSAQAPSKHFADGATKLPDLREPVGKWELREDQDRCLLQRTFGNAAQAFSLTILPHPGLTTVDLLLRGPELTKVGSTKRARLIVEPSQRSFDGKLEFSKARDDAPVAQVAVDTGLLDELASAAGLGVEAGNGPPIRLHLTGAANAIAALKTCEDQLLQAWGVDPARFRPVVPQGKPGFVDLARFFGADAYPAAAGNAEGRVLALLSLDAEGKVADCRVFESSGNSALDQRTCEVTLRFRYPVIHDQSGKAVASWTMFQMRWAR